MSNNKIDFLLTGNPTKSVSKRQGKPSTLQCPYLKTKTERFGLEATHSNEFYALKWFC